MTFNFKSKALLSFFLFSLSLNIVNFTFSHRPVFPLFDQLKNSNLSFSGKIERIQSSTQDSNLEIFSGTSSSNTDENEINPSSEPNQSLFDLLEMFRIPFLLLGIMLLIFSYKILKTLEIYEFYNTDKEGVITFRSENEFEKHKASGKKGKFVLFLGLVILLFSVFLFF